MKATGIVRNLDQLGRLTLPVELRRVMNISMETPLEICGGEGESIIVRKYQPDGGLAEAAQDLCQALHKTLQSACVICDRDRVIVASNGFCGNCFFHTRLSPMLIAEMRNGWKGSNEPKRLPVLDEPPVHQAMLFPIYRGAEVSGCVGIECDGESITDEAFTAMQLAAALLTQKLGR